MSVIIVQPKTASLHVQYPGLLERQARVKCLGELLSNYCSVTTPENFLLQEEKKMLSLAHDLSYIEWIQKLSRAPEFFSFFMKLFDGRVQYYNRVMPKTYCSARDAAIAACYAVHLSLENKRDRFFCPLRPPGHHAGSNFGQGFCFFNNAAIAAAYYKKLNPEPSKKVVIVDFDRHHGNGTEEIVGKINNQSIYFVSSYENSGHHYATSFNTNPSNCYRISLVSGMSESKILEVYKSVVSPFLSKINPSFLIISAGFDMHFADKLTTLQMTAEGYGTLTKVIVNSAPNAKAISLLEGGYDLPALKDCVSEHLSALNS